MELPLVLKEMEGITPEIIAYCDEAIEWQRHLDQIEVDKLQSRIKELEAENKELRTRLSRRCSECES